MTPFKLVPFLGILAMAGCDNRPLLAPAFEAAPYPGRAQSGPLIETVGVEPDLTGPTCFHHIPGAPKVEFIEVTEVIDPPITSSDGVEVVSGTYRTFTKPVEVDGANGQWFAKVCEEALTEEFVTALQRALLVRGVFPGTIDGTLGPSTLEGIRLFQQSRGLDSDVLSLAAARQLGLIAIEIDA